MKKILATMIFLLVRAIAAFAQGEIRVNPTNVNVYSQGPTTVFLTFGNLGNYRPAQAFWCGDLQPATPAVGFICAPGTIYGTLPSRYDVSRRSGNNAYTDIVSAPASVARRAYQAAARGEDSQFYYVRRFTSDSGAPDQFVSVTMRLTGNGAGVPFSLTDVQLDFGAGGAPRANGQEPLVLFVEAGGKAPPIRADIKYTGAGRLRGRWEVVRPGDPQPEPRDLLPEASLPLEERGTQRRYTQLARFNVFLPPGGRYVLQGPDPARVPIDAAGQYLILLRVEASDDRENISDLSVVDAGAGVAQGGAAAGFPLPALRYVVGGGDNTRNVSTANSFESLLPRDGVAIPAGDPIDFAWAASPQAAFYRLEVEDANGKLILSAMLKSSVRNYRAPSWLKSKITNGNLSWRVVALGRAGQRVGETEKRKFQLTRSP
ncbi:MAG TPA: hypothetical protein VIC84_03605 [Blastocatellia bacterium]|jgi:hypothetical protein